MWEFQHKLCMQLTNWKIAILTLYFYWFTTVSISATLINQSNFGIILDGIMFRIVLFLVLPSLDRFRPRIVNQGLSLELHPPHAILHTILDPDQTLSLILGKTLLIILYPNLSLSLTLSTIFDKILAIIRNTIIILDKILAIILNTIIIYALILNDILILDMILAIIS